MTPRRAKQTDLWNQEVLTEHVWVIFGTVVFKVIMGSFSALVILSKRLFSKRYPYSHDSFFNEILYRCSLWQSPFRTSRFRAFKGLCHFESLPLSPMAKNNIESNVKRAKFPVRQKRLVVEWKGVNFRWIVLVIAMVNSESLCALVSKWLLTWKYGKTGWN